jgi:protein-tyrosine phosphatase
MTAKPSQSLNILFVCMGNVCRSPTAEGVFRHYSRNLDREIYIDSAATSIYHVGDPPDPRTIDAAKQRGYDLTSIVSRQVAKKDFEQFDMILAMDKENYTNLVDMANQWGMQQHIKKIKLFLSFAKYTDFDEVPDPYYGLSQMFDLVVDLAEDASQGLVEYIQKR